MKRLIAIAVIALSATVAVAQKPSVVLSDKPGWHKIAENHVSYKTDADSVFVLWNDHFKQIKLKAHDADVNLQRFDVVYENGTTQSIPLKGMLKNGEETVATPLTQTDNAIRKVVLVYNTVAQVQTPGETEKERAEVEIWGLK